MIKKQRRLSKLLKLLFFIILFFLIVIMIRVAGELFLFRNPEYILKNLDIHLNGILTTKDFNQMTGIRLGKNIFGINLQKANSTLSAIPEVHHVIIKRIIPDTLFVNLQPRIPTVALIVHRGRISRLFFCDKEGYIFRPEKTDQSFPFPPIVEGLLLDTSQLIPSKHLENEDLKHAICTVVEIENIPENLLKIKSIDVSKSYITIVHTSENITLIFGINNLVYQIEKLYSILSSSEVSGRKIATINLRIKKNTPVTFVESVNNYHERNKTITFTKKKKDIRINYR